MNKISIIIPILNEAENIQNLLQHLMCNSKEEHISEIIVVDGGSTVPARIAAAPFPGIGIVKIAIEHLPRK
uniref:glycosyltransferase n=1 Tax=Xanthomarina gelatinilytica TaxID=1137281 RepID=UPI0035173AC4